jgi:DNA modification methylase
MAGSGLTPETVKQKKMAQCHEGGSYQFCRHCGAWRGSFGLEPTIEMYVEHTVAIFRELRRVLRKDGVLWLNLGDSYSSGGRTSYDSDDKLPNRAHSFRPGAGRADGKVDERGQRNRNGTPPSPGLKPKDLCGVPWRVALALQADGWWLRSEITWCKKAPMPESCQDRPTSATEKVFLLTKSSKYFYDKLGFEEEAGMVNGSILSGGTESTLFSSSALRPKFDATFYADNGSFSGRGGVDFGNLELTVDDSMTRDAVRYQILNPVGLKIGLETPEGDYVVNLKDALSGPTSLTSKIISFLSDLSLDRPVSSFITNRPAFPCGAILAYHVGGDPLPAALSTAKIVSLECAFVASEFFATKVTLQINQAVVTLFVFTSLWSTHVKYHRKNTNESQGKNCRNFWLLGPEAFPAAHFAVFPQEIPRRAILLGTSEKGCCPKCGAGWRRVVEKETQVPPYRKGNKPETLHAYHGESNTRTLGMVQNAITTGWTPTCTCSPAEPIPCTVLDPFSGAGTTALVAAKLGRDAIGIELNPEYVEMSRKRIAGDLGMLCEIEVKETPK